MEANLYIKDIGGLRGERVFKLKKGKLNLIEASNSGGKTSVIKALTAVLSIPPDGYLDLYTDKEARKLGIKSEERNPQQGFVNIHAKEGTVRLEINDKTETYRVKQSGEHIELPQEGDQRFLLAGILSNDSRILRQLRGLDEEYEPEDFKWAVTQLSFAKNYDEIRDYLLTKKEDLLEKEYAAERKIEQLASLDIERQKLLKKRDKLDKELKELGAKFKGIKDPIRKRKDLTDNINKYEEFKGKKIGEIKKKKDEIKNLEKKLSVLDKKIKEKNKELKNIQIEALEKENKIKKEENEEKITKLKEKRSGIDGLLNLFVTAQSSLRGTSEEIICPLCNDGTISYKEVESRLKDLRAQKDKISSEIKNLNLENIRLSQELQKQVDYRDKLKRELRDLEGEKYHLNKALNERKMELGQLQYDIEQHNQMISKWKKQLEILRSKISSEDEELDKLYTKKERERAEVSVRISDINRELEESSMEVDGDIVEPKIAKQIYEKWIEYIENKIEFTKKRADEQRQEAAKQFNANINELMAELGFKEFRNIKLNNNYQLYVERLKEKTGEYVPQQVKSLSTSEKLTIAMILQIALKETYLPNTNFFILDDIISDFDEDRKNIVLNYLLNKAKEKDWFIVATNLIEEDKPVEIRYFGG